MILTTGSITMRNNPFCEAIEAKSRARTRAMTKPESILRSVKAAEYQNNGQTRRERSVENTLHGDGRNSSSPIAMEAIHQIAIQKTMAEAFKALLDEIEIFKRSTASYSLRILGLKH